MVMGIFLYNTIFLIKVYKNILENKSNNLLDWYCLNSYL
jgi:hypothetical protein